jgi:hypothetical protein
MLPAEAIIPLLVVALLICTFIEFMMITSPRETDKPWALLWCLVSLVICCLLGGAGQEWNSAIVHRQEAEIVRTEKVDIVIYGNRTYNLNHISNRKDVKKVFWAYKQSYWYFWSGYWECDYDEKGLETQTDANKSK